MINKQNYFEMTKGIDFSTMPATLSNGHEAVIRYTQNGMDWQYYYSNEVTRRVFDMHFEKLNKYLTATAAPAVPASTAKSESKPTKSAGTGSRKAKSVAKKAKAVAKSKSTPQRQAKSKKPAAASAEKLVPAEKKEGGTSKVGHLSEAVKLIKRFYSFNGKNKPKRSLLLFIRALQKSIKEKRITKSSEHHELILNIQEKALNAYEMMEKDDTSVVKIEFTPEYKARIEKVVKAQRVYGSLPLIKRYIGLAGEKPGIEKVERLVNAIDNALSKKKITKEDPYLEEIKEIRQTLKDYLAKRRTSIKVSQATFNGLAGLFGSKKKVAAATVEKTLSREARQELIDFNLSEQKRYRTATSDGVPLGNIEVDGTMPDELEEIFGESKRKINGIQLPGHLGRFLGLIEQYEYALVLRGEKGAGKSRLLYQLMDTFADYGFTIGNFSLEMAKDGLVASGYKDQYVKPENQAQIKSASEAPNGVNTIRKAAQFFDVIVIDSWTKLNAPQTEFDKLRKEFPHTFFLVIFQSTVAGTSRGGSGAEYDAGAVLQVKNGGIAFFEKNRYATEDSMELEYNVFNKKVIEPIQSNPQPNE